VIAEKNYKQSRKKSNTFGIHSEVLCTGEYEPNKASKQPISASWPASINSQRLSSESVVDFVLQPKAGLVRT